MNLNIRDANKITIYCIQNFSKTNKKKITSPSSLVRLSLISSKGRKILCLFIYFYFGMMSRKFFAKKK